ncbi:MULTISPECIES: AMP-binding protein [unclassified Streptomyces]|uniref:AMP-binding protein n=1 Tax=unclassified Streptomyces TaxID=2593676 RepID=UPI0037A2D4D3
MSATSPRTAVDLLLDAAQHHPESGLRYCATGNDGGSHRQSYPELLDEALRVLTGLRAQGLEPRDNVVLILERPQEFLPAFWACVLGGFVPCPMARTEGDPRRWEAALRHVHRLLDEPLVITTASVAAELPPVPSLVSVSFDQLHAPERAKPHTAAPEDTALLMLTSGSTGNSKAVMLSHANLLSSMAGKNSHHRITADDTTLNWISFDHVAALLECHLLPLAYGSDQLHARAQLVLADPPEFLRLLSRHRVTMSFTPNFLLGLLNSAADELRASGERLDLSAVRQIISGGEAVVRATGETFLDRFAEFGLGRHTLWPAFGMTETCAGSVYSSGAFPDADRGGEFADLGTPVTGLGIRIAGPDDRPLPPGEVGELQFSGPMITRGYYADAQATREAFTADGWFRSGDLGRLDEGRLSLVGRSKDSIIVNGVNYFSHELETVLEQLDGVSGSYVAAFPVRPEGSDTEDLVIAFHPDVPPGDEGALFRVMTSLRTTLVSNWGLRPSLVLPLPKAAFPKTSLGKNQRSLMRRRLDSGDYDEQRDAVAALRLRMLGGFTAPEGETEETLARIYAEIFGVPTATISATANFFDLGGTSLDILRLRGKVAQRLGVGDLEVITLLTAPTVRALAAHVTEKPLPGTRTYDPIVPLQTGGAKTPIFCVHPGVGEVLVFVNLAKYFVDDRPFYALRARGFNEGEKPFTSFEEMVETYVGAIQDRQPHGPYAIAGYSFGAAVAFEIAKMLRSRGERVDFVGSINLPPHIKYRMEELDHTETATNLAFFLGLIDETDARELPHRLRDLPPGEMIRRLMAAAPPERLDALDLDARKLENWANLANSITDLGRSYEPSGTVPSMTVFYANPLRGTKQAWLDDELRRWDGHTTGPNRYIEVDGAHYTLMGPQHVASFQATLRRELDRAMENPDADRGSSLPSSGQHRDR